MVIGLILLMALPRLTALNQYLIVDEADRWLWVEDFVHALSRGDLASTLVGDGYPGIVPVWAESVWIFLEAIRRSFAEGQWIGEPGLNLLFHQWDRPAFLVQQRLPIVLLNTAIALVIVWAVWRLFGKHVALVSGLLIALDPFYLSDSRVNRAEAVITGLMTLSVLTLIFYYRQRRFHYVIVSGFLGGLGFLTKIQALSMLPAIVLTGLLIYADDLKGGGQVSGVRRQESKGRRQKGESHRASIQNLATPTNPQGRGGQGQQALPMVVGHASEIGNRKSEIRNPKSIVWFGLGWGLAACLTWFILWPSMWVTPLETLTLVYNYTTRKVGAEGVSLFFLGQTYRDADPGVLFYPIVFLMRMTPLALLGLIGAIIASLRRWGLTFSKGGVEQTDTLPGNPFTAKGSAILVIYVLVYALIMTIGSHKQDRYLMPVFLGLDILAAMGLVYMWVWVKSKIGKKSKDERLAPYFLLPTPYLEWLLFTGLVVIQLATVLPHHPYYFSYFNPLLGGGQTAVRTMRIGWGEGMDQVGAYLATKPNSRDLVVSSRFTHNMLGFKGELLSLGSDGRWTKADYIVLYIQQVQRRLDPSPGFIDYFQARQPEKVITLGGIDYAWIYPIPFTTPANPHRSVIPGRAALLGYSWETNERTSLPRPTPSHLRLWWGNLGMSDHQQLLVRLINATSKTEWTACFPDPAFTKQAQTPGDYVESLCAPVIADLPPGNYTLEFGLAPKDLLSDPSLKSERITEKVETFLFPEGRQAARVTAAGEIVDTPEAERLEAIVAQNVPATAQRLDRIYDDRLKLVAYQIEPPQPGPGDRLELRLYWQLAKELEKFFTSASNAQSWRTAYWQPDKTVTKPIRLVIQLADSRSISLGRIDAEPPIAEWLPGEVIVAPYEFELAPDLEGPLAAQVEVNLINEAEIPIRATNLTGQTLEAAIARFTIAPNAWPDLENRSQVANWREVEAAWQGDITLRGYELSSERARPGESLQVSLFWEAGRPVAENYIAFVHLLDETGQIRTQNDSLPRAGAYPTPWWQPGRLVEDVHPLVLPEDLPGGVYQLVVGLYRPEDGLRLQLIDEGDSFVAGTLQILNIP